ncbi:hypothetical protein SAICODRAFT_73457 [Saitoella complicata NRRL Y-17804]|uniref:uncharacterized protein n=1 Tax=Saitoella complicata (strain BCRC 22490 / CBS 7301 / JCM 7358 / NBRC 10748 / NRRL Y-17804) TaxID=698492 RepID=UPI0008675F5B|nr:uncharacterized protein SAICODRAFT_73457 [Saitoella complicata NRRL Y-17804]ODQ50418.1 hypothetical protein SAICODRAFT_73457 [Saitoella complicata NRRL Y-17804]
MKTTLYTLAALVSALTAQAIMVTSPNQYTVWSSAANSSTAITWTSVSTDPSTFDIYLVDMTSSPSYSSLLPLLLLPSRFRREHDGNLHTGETVQVNFVALGKPEQIYAQSGQFDIVEAAAAESSSAAASSTSATASASSTSASASSTSAAASGSASASSARSVDASSSSSAAAAVASSASGSATSSMRSAASSISRAAASASGSGSAAAASASGSAVASTGAGVSNVKMSGAALLGMGVAVIAGGALVM